MSDSEESSFDGSYGSLSTDSYDSDDDEKRDSEDSSEMMVIEIAFGKGKQDKIIVHWNDSPEELAKEFVNKHGMKEAAVPAIASHITSTIEDFKATNAELRAQSPSLDDTYSEQSKNDSNYQDNRQSPSNPMDLPAQHTKSIPATSPIPILKSKPDSEMTGSPTTQPPELATNTDRSKPIAIGSTKGTPIEVDTKIDSTGSDEQVEDDGSLQLSKSSEESGDISEDSGKGGPRKELAVEVQEENLALPTSPNVSEKVAKILTNLPVHADSAELRGERYATTPPDQDDVDEEVKLKEESMMYARLKSAWKTREKKAAPGSAKKAKPSPLPKNVVQRSSLVLASSHQRESQRQTVMRPSKGKNASERLYRNAEIQAKRRDMNKARADAKAESDLQASQFQLSESSKAVVKTISVASKQNITERLYEQGLKKKKKKDELAKKRQEEMETEVPSWSCFQCGTIHDIGFGERTGMKSAQQKKLICRSCGYVCETEEVLPFHPTNINSQRSGFDKNETIKNRKKNDPIHEYLYANRELQVKKSHLVSNAWGSEDEIFTFRPVIPESSKALLRKHSRREINESCDTATSVTSKKKIPVASAGLDQYLNLPVAERLIVGETLCRLSKPGKVPKRKTQRKTDDDPPKPAKRTESEAAETYDRLVAEFWEIRARRERAEKLASKYDMTTKKRLFRPSRGPPPVTEAYKAVIVDDSQQAIHDRLIREGVEHNRRIDNMQRMHAEKEAKDLEEGKIHALPKSMEILEEAMQQNTEEIYQILVANQEMILHAAQHNEPLVRSKESIAEMINMISTNLEQDWKGLHIDVRLIEPEILVEDMRELITEVKRRGVQHVKKRGGDGEINYRVSYKTFVAMLKSSLKKRDGVGRAYIYTPKPRDDVTRHLLEEEAEMITFQPEIEKRSAKLAKRRGRTGDLPIEDILAKEGDRVKAKIESARREQDIAKQKECSFQPTFFQPPKRVVPTYRGQDRNESKASGGLKSRVASNAVTDEYAPISLSINLDDAYITAISDSESPPTEADAESRPVVGRLSKSNIEKAFLSLEQCPTTDDDDGSSVPQSEVLVSTAAPRSTPINRKHPGDRPANTSPKPFRRDWISSSKTVSGAARGNKGSTSRTSSRSDVSSAVDSYDDTVATRSMASSSISSSPRQSQNVQRVDALQNKKGNGVVRKGSWHGSLATGWMQKNE